MLQINSDDSMSLSDLLFDELNFLTELFCRIIRISVTS